MIKIYSYYTCGGYKDFFIGTFDEEPVESKYYISLYDIYVERQRQTPADDSISEKLKLWDSLHRIYPVNEDSSDAYPRDASILISHAGYKVIYKKIVGGQLALSIRDISGPLDEYSRPSPFNIMFISDDAVDDRRVMDKMAEHIRLHLADFEIFCSGIFEYDPYVNALKFKFGDFVNGIKDEISHIDLKDSNDTDKDIRLLVIPDGIPKELAAREQSIDLKDVENLFTLQGNIISTGKQPVEPSLEAQRNSSLHKADSEKNREARTENPTELKTHKSPTAQDVQTTPDIIPTLEEDFKSKIDRMEEMLNLAEGERIKENEMLQVLEAKVSLLEDKISQIEENTLRIRLIKIRTFFKELVAKLTGKIQIIWHKN